MTPERYKKILHWLNAHPAAKRLVILLNHWLPAVPFVCYPVLLVLLNLQWFRLLRGGFLSGKVSVPYAVADTLLLACGGVSLNGSLAGHFLRDFLTRFILFYFSVPPIRALARAQYSAFISMPI